LFVQFVQVVVVVAVLLLKGKVMLTSFFRRGGKQASKHLRFRL